MSVLPGKRLPDSSVAENIVCHPTSRATGRSNGMYFAGRELSPNYQCPRPHALANRQRNHWVLISKKKGSILRLIPSGGDTLPQCKLLF